MKQILFLLSFILLISGPASGSEKGYTIIISAKMKDSARNLEQGIQRVVGNLEPRELDYNSPEAKPWIEKLGIKMVPYVIFDRDIAQNEKFIELASQKMIVRKNGEYVIPDAMLVPVGVMFFQREYKPGQLDIFIMSQCPYGNTALTQISNYIERAPGAFNVKCHYITTFREFGIDSLHGPEEIKEDINHLLVQEKYPEKFWQYIKNRQQGKSFEDSCMLSGINHSELMRFRDEGIDLLQKDFNLCRELGIDSSPTFLWENQILTSNIDLLRQFLPERAAAIPAHQPAPEGALNMAVFYSPSCSHCRWLLEEYIPKIEKEFAGRIGFEYYDTSKPENFEKQLNMEKEYGALGSGVPEVFIAGKSLRGQPDIEGKLKGIIEQALAGEIASLPLASLGAPRNDIGKNVIARPRFIGAEAISKTNTTLLDRFKLFSPFAVAGAGFLDGINPCAFSTIIFFISFLVFAGFSRARMAFAAFSFTLAVFLTYLGIGAGAFMGIKHLRMVDIFSRYFDPAVGIIALLLGAGSIYDYIQFRRTGGAGGMILKLPSSVKNAIHQSIRGVKEGGTGIFKLLSAAFGIGVVVSLLESMCTGQVYLPTITFILKMDVMKWRAFLFLILYNLMFIVPLVVVSIVTLCGASSQWWASLMQKNLGKVKLIMAMLFFGMGILILSWK